MSRVKFALHSQRGFMLLSVVFLTMITAVAAMILMNASTRVRNPQSTLELTALYLANEQFARLESKAAAGEQIGGSYSFLGDAKDLTSENAGAGKKVTFEMTTTVSGGDILSDDKVAVRDATVVVRWQIGDKDFEREFERKILFVAPKTQ